MLTENAVENMQTAIEDAWNTYESSALIDIADLPPTPAMEKAAARQKKPVTFDVDAAKLARSTEEMASFIDTLNAELQLEMSAGLCIAQLNTLAAFKSVAYIDQPTYTRLKSAAITIVNHAQNIHACLMDPEVVPEPSAKCTTLIQRLADLSKQPTALYIFEEPLSDAKSIDLDQETKTAALIAYQDHCARRRDHSLQKQPLYRKGEIIGAKDSMQRWWMARVEAILRSSRHPMIYYIEFIGFPAQQWEFIADITRLAKFNPMRHQQFRSNNAMSPADLIDVS